MKLRLDFMPPDYRAHFVAAPYDFVLDPFRVAGNLYFIGNKEIGCYLIDSGEGLIILDTGFESCSGQFFNSIWALGFNPRDVKKIFHTHYHSDHIGSTNLLVRLSGATTYMSEVDARILGSLPLDQQNPAALRFVPDVLTHDGDEYTLGNVTVKCIDTPGHTPGCQSFFFNVTDHDKSYIAAIHGGIGINTLHIEIMKQSGYMSAREDFFNHLERVRDWPVDIYLGSHTLQSRMEEKLALRAADPAGPNPFIDPAEWGTVMDIARDMAHELIKDEEAGKVPDWQKQGYADLK